MIEVSGTFKQAMREPVKVIKAIITGEVESYSSSDTLMSFTVESAGYYFRSATKALSFKLLGNDYNLIGETVGVTLSVCTNSAQDLWEDCYLGSFKIYEQKSDIEKGFTTFTAYDKIGQMASQKYDSNITFPTTVENLVIQIAAKFNLVYETHSLVNGNYLISEDLYARINDITYRDILSEIAGATASLIVVDGVTDTLKIVAPPLESSETLTYDNLKKYSIKPKYGPVNSVVLARTPQEDNIAVVDNESVELYGLTELKLANNEILDDDRELLAHPILDAVDGFEWYPFEADTEGHGWYEVGDMITVTDGNNSWDVIITDIKLSVDGGIKETIKGVMPTETQTDYALAGGITKTIYNTQIKVDKQNQEIQSIVQEMTSLEGQVNDNYTEIHQTINNVVTSVQNSGGNNLIKNSAMYSINSDTQLPDNWSFSSGGDLIVQPSAEATVYGSLSGQAISLIGKKAIQNIAVSADDASIPESSKIYYSFSCRIKKTATGTCYVKITDGTEHGIWSIDLDNGDSSTWEDYSIEGILPMSTQLTIEVFGSSDSEFSITDMMLAVGNYRSNWSQANGEFANTQVAIDTTGVKITNSNLHGSYSKLDSQGLIIFDSNSESSFINNDGVHTKSISAESEIDMPPLKIVPQSDGWAFVPKE